MRKTITILISIFLSFNLFAQTDFDELNSKKNQINIGYFNILNFSDGNDLGLGYKRTFKKSALRIASSFLHYKSTNDEDINFDDSDDEEFSYMNSSTKIKPRIGYEFHTNTKRVQIFYGFDIIGLIENHSYKRVNVRYPEQNIKNSNKAFGIGLSPAIGIKFQISKTFSISTETNFDVMYSMNESKRTNSEGYERISKSNSTSVKLNPIGIVSFNIHF